MSIKKLNKIIIPVINICLLAVMILPCSIACSGEQTEEIDDVALRYPVDGHIIGFGSRGIYLAGLDHALSINFSGGSEVQPVAIDENIAEDGSAALGTVCYSNVWENIDIMYIAIEGGIAESIYTINPGGDPEDISLEYNVPVKIMDSGELLFQFENGYMTESAPSAWQEIDGDKQPVEARFKQHDDNRIGIALRSYDKNSILYIDPVYR